MRHPFIDGLATNIEPWTTLTDDDTNGTSSSSHKFPVDHHVAYVAAVPMLFCNGIAAIMCVWFCSTVYRRSAFHHVTYYSLIGQSFTDFCFALFNFIAGLTALPSGVFTGSCEASGFFTLFVIAGSVMSFCLVAWTRRIAVIEARAGRQTVMNGAWVAKRQIIVVGISAALTAGAVTVSGGLELAPSGRYCWSSLDDDISTNAILLIWVFSLIFISGCYVSIYRHVVEVRKMVSMRNDQISRRVAAEGNLALRMVIAVVVFIISYIPAMMQTATCGAGVDEWCGDGSLDVLTEAGQVILVIINPFMYIAMDTKLRLEAVSQLHYCRRKLQGKGSHASHHSLRAHPSSAPPQGAVVKGNGAQYKLNALASPQSRHDQAWMGLPNGGGVVRNSRSGGAAVSPGGGGDGVTGNGSQNGKPLTNAQSSPPVTEYHQLVDGTIHATRDGTPPIILQAMALQPPSSTYTQHNYRLSHVSGGTPYESHITQGGPVPFPSPASYRHLVSQGGVGVSRSMGIETMQLPQGVVVNQQQQHQYLHHQYLPVAASSGGGSAHNLASPNHTENNTTVDPDDILAMQVPTPQHGNAMNGIASSLFNTPSSAMGPFAATTRNSAMSSLSTPRMGNGQYHYTCNNNNNNNNSVYMAASPSAAAQPLWDGPSLSSQQQPLPPAAPAPTPQQQQRSIAAPVVLPGTVGAATPQMGPRAVIVTKYDDDASHRAPPPLPPPIIPTMEQHSHDGYQQLHSPHDDGAGDLSSRVSGNKPGGIADDLLSNRLSPPPLAAQQAVPRMIPATGIPPSSSMIVPGNTSGSPAVMEQSLFKFSSGSGMSSAL